MPLGNYGAVMHQIQGFVASEFTSSRASQGLSYLPQVIQLIASNAALTESNLRVTAPRAFDGTNDVDVESGAVKLLAVVFDNTEAADNTPVVYETTAVTEGTTVPRIALNMAASTLRVLVFPEPLEMAALAWSVLDGDALTNSSTLAAANSVKAMFIYAE